MGRYATGSTGIVVRVPEADAVVASVRRRYHPAFAFAVPAQYGEIRF